VPPGKPGRPPSLVKGCTVSTYLREPEIDRLARLARRHDMSLSGLLRQLIRRELRGGGVEKIGEK
jgi:hypothetical protein